MADVPVNEKLYAMVVSQAKAKYRIYPSPGASHWVHRRYLELGGRFIDSEEVAQRKEVLRRWQEARAKARGKGSDKDAPKGKKDKKDKK
jgi:hypothetical protein